MKSYLAQPQSKTKPRGHKLCFIHIPKCGGTSIRSSLKRNWLDILLNKKISLDHIASTDAAIGLGKDVLVYREELLRYFLSSGNSKYVFGHFKCTNQTRELFQQQWKFVTLIRDPLKRWLSHYYFDRYRNTNVNYNKTDLEIQEYLESQEGFRNSRMYLRHFSSYTLGDEVIPDHVNSAVTNIMKFDVFGILERMEWFIADYRKITGINLKQLKRNTNPKKNYANQPSQQILQQINELCYYDIQIYNKVKCELERKRDANK